MTNSADPDQLASSEANWSGSTLFDKTGHVVFSKRMVNMFTCIVGYPDKRIISTTLIGLRLTSECASIMIDSCFQYTVTTLLPFRHHSETGKRFFFFFFFFFVAWCFVLMDHSVPFYLFFIHFIYLFIFFFLFVLFCFFLIFLKYLPKS